MNEVTVETKLSKSWSLLTLNEVTWWIIVLFCLILYKRRQWHPTPVLLPGKSHGQRSLVGCSPWGHRGSDMTERFHFLFSLSCIGEGNGTPLQCSCLENPRDRGAWWAAVYGVAQSRTWLKWLSIALWKGTHYELSCLSSCALTLKLISESKFHKNFQLTNQKITQSIKN